MEYASAIIPGGKFSLGRLKHGSGYCVGAIVETRMGLKEEKEGMTGSSKQGVGSAAASVRSQAGNGMRDVWVIGERFFRGVGGVFDVSAGDRTSSLGITLLTILFYRYRKRESDFEHTKLDLPVIQSMSRGCLDRMDTTKFGLCIVHHPISNTLRRIE